MNTIQTDNDHLNECMARAGAAITKSDAERIARMQADPNNGRFGWWRVEGTRRGAIVKASSAMEACEKAKDVVESWEFPEALWIGTELPEVIEV